MPFPFKMYSTVLLLCVSGYAAFCTTVAIIRTPTEIFAAADSSFMTGSSLGPNFCKIVQVGNTFLAFSGMADITVSDAKLTSFHGFKLARKAAETPGTMLEKGTAFSAMAYQTFKRAVPLVKKYSPAQYKAQLLGHSQAFEVMFFGLNPDKTPAFDLERFAVSENKRGDITVTPHRHACPGSSCGPTEVKLEILGVNDKAVSDSNKPGFFTGKWEHDVRHLIDIEISDQPQFVRPPIDVLRISALSTDWINHKAQCPDIQSYGTSGTAQPRKKKRSSVAR